MGRMKRTAALVAWLGLSSGGALGFCVEPSAPYCATKYGAFDDEYAFSKCRREMESYKSDVELFMSCQNDIIRKAKQEADAVVSTYQDAVSSFNRRARQ